MSSKLFPTTTTIHSLTAISSNSELSSSGFTNKIATILKSLYSKKQQILSRNAVPNQNKLDQITINKENINKFQPQQLITKDQGISQTQQYDTPHFSQDKNTENQATCNHQKLKKNILQTKIQRAREMVGTLEDQHQRKNEELMRLVGEKQMMQISLKSLVKASVSQIKQDYVLIGNPESESGKSFNHKNFLLELMEIEEKITSLKLKPMKILCKFYHMKGIEMDCDWGIRYLCQNKLVNELYGMLINMTEFRNSTEQLVEAKNKEQWMLYLRKLKSYEKYLSEGHTKTTPWQEKIDLALEMKQKIRISGKKIEQIKKEVDELQGEIQMKKQYLMDLQKKCKTEKQINKHKEEERRKQNISRQLKEINEAIKYFQAKVNKQKEYKYKLDPNNFTSPTKSTNQLLKSYLMNKTIEKASKFQANTCKIIGAYRSPVSKIQIRTDTQESAEKRSRQKKQISTLCSPKEENYLALYRSNSKRKMSNSRSQTSIWK